MLYLDTNILVYLLERHERYSDIVAQTLEGIDDELISSTITIVEFLAGTMSSDLSTLQQVPRLHFIELDDRLAEQAAMYQRQDNLQIGNAIHLATAIQQGAETFFTHDRQLAKAAAKYLTVKGL